MSHHRIPSTGWCYLHCQNYVFSSCQVIHALAECRPIVTPSYFDDVVNLGSTSSTLPTVERYCNDYDVAWLVKAQDDIVNIQLKLEWMCFINTSICSIRQLDNKLAGYWCNRFIYLDCVETLLASELWLKRKIDLNWNQWYQLCQH